MAKKQRPREEIDEALILNLIGGVDAPPTLVPKQAPATPPPETPPPERYAPDAATEKVPKSKDQSEAYAEYRQTYFQYRKYDARITCRLDCEMRRKLSLMVQLFGGKNLNVTCLVNNILFQHLEEHRKEINTLIENTTKNMKL
ncbi:DUF3408 domain-containing protein [Alistipes finegoldii]|uniref:DUF3408 domain-containing protein n=1 Tax=Alistipes finegoldii TaxID=214856 RepID=UPI003A8DE431